MRFVNIPLIGGPLDGQRYSGESQDSFVDVNFEGEWFVYRPRYGRRRWVLECYPDAHRCSNCFAVVDVPRTVSCPLCGAKGPEEP